eukprot:1441168-Rhodomonas_salina.2
MLLAFFREPDPRTSALCQPASNLHHQCANKQEDVNALSSERNAFATLLHDPAINRMWVSSGFCPSETGADCTTHIHAAKDMAKQIARTGFILAVSRVALHGNGGREWGKLGTKRLPGCALPGP